MGNHTFKFGYDGRRFNVHNPFSANNSGSFSFGNTGTYTTGDGGLDFLLGVPATYSQGSGASIIAEAFLNYVFAQDTWKVTPTFTLSYGLGYSIDTPLHNHQYGGDAHHLHHTRREVHSLPRRPDEPGLSAATRAATTPAQATTRYGEFGPRVGFAWAPDLGRFSGAPRQVLHPRRLRHLLRPHRRRDCSADPGDASLRDHAAPAVNGRRAPRSPIHSLTSTAAASVANPFPYTFPKKGANIDFAALEARSTTSAPTGRDFRAPYAENIQLSVEREFPSRVVARVSYVGSLARHNQTTTDANPITPAGHAACVADTTLRHTGYTGRNTIYREEQSYFFPQHTPTAQIDPPRDSLDS